MTSDRCARGLPLSSSAPRPGLPDSPRGGRSVSSTAPARRAAVATLTGLLLAGCSATGSAPSPTPSGSPSAVAAAWTTTDDGKQRLAPLAVERTTDAPEVSVEGAGEQQQVTGFGVTLTHSSAQLLMGMAPAARTSLLRELFAPDGPVRLGLLRLPLGASDFVASRAFTYDDMPAGQQDWDLVHFSTSADDAALRPVVREILSINPSVQVVASPWSPPGWLKDPAGLDGGRLSGDSRAVTTYARYLVRYLQASRDAGIPVHWLSVQNEPQLRHPDGYPGTDLPADTEAALLQATRAAIRNAGLDTRLMGYDHNWEESQGDVASTPPGEDPHTQYPSDLLHLDPQLAGMAWHCYSGDASAMTRLADGHPGLVQWVSECSGSHQAGDSPEKYFTDTLDWQAEHLFVASLRNRAQAVFTYNLALDDTGGPHVGGCATCTGLVTLGNGIVQRRNAEYYALAQAGRAFPRGSTVLEVGQAGGLDAVAARTATGTSFLLWNGDDQARTVVVGRPGSGLRLQLPARSLTTVEQPR